MRPQIFKPLPLTHSVLVSRLLVTLMLAVLFLAVSFQSALAAGPTPTPVPTTPGATPAGSGAPAFNLDSSLLTILTTVVSIALVLAIGVSWSRNKHSRTMQFTPEGEMTGFSETIEQSEFRLEATLRRSSSNRNRSKEEAKPSLPPGN